MRSLVKIITALILLLCLSSCSKDEKKVTRKQSNPFTGDNRFDNGKKVKQNTSIKSVARLVEHPKVLAAPYAKFSNLLEEGEFRWTSRYKQSVRSTKPREVFGDTAIESVFHVKKSKISKVDLLYYSKADSEAISFDEFDQKRMALGKFLTKKLKVRAKRVKHELNDSEKTKIYEWVKGNNRYRLEAVGSNSLDLEYLRLIIKPKKSLKLRFKRGTELVRMLRKKVDGDVYINRFPMVDQGDKGYCVCASLARVLQHFGRDIDQHEIAQLANASKFGTSPQDLIRALDELSPKVYVDNHSLGFFALSRYRGSLRDFVPRAKNYYKRYRLHFSRYENHLFFAIDAGRPVAWAMLLGLIPEEGLPQQFGGHMRVIIGYNKRTREIIYTDSWGYGHELKRMDLDDAMTVTFGMWEMRPEI